MAAGRRKKLFIDRIFQSRLLSLFIMLSIICVMANACYMFVNLKADVEEQKYRSHVAITNINDIVMQNLVSFSLFMVLTTLTLTGLFYWTVRMSLSGFVDQVTRAIHHGGDPLKNNILQPRLFGEFEDFAEAFHRWQKALEEKSRQSDQVIRRLRSFIDDPDETDRTSLIKELEGFLPSR